VQLVRNLSLDFELTQTSFFNTYLYNIAGLIQFKPVLNYRFAKHFKMYAGPSFNLLAQGYRGDIRVPYSIYHREAIRRGPAQLDFWIGVVGGIKF
jgi:hypothetical protein